MWVTLFHRHEAAWDNIAARDRVNHTSIFNKILTTLAGLDSLPVAFVAARPLEKSNVVLPNTSSSAQRSQRVRRLTALTTAGAHAHSSFTCLSIHDHW